MVSRYYLVEIKRIQKLDLPILPPTHHVQLPTMSVSNRRNHGSRVVSTRVLQHNHVAIGYMADMAIHVYALRVRGTRARPRAASSRGRTRNGTAPAPNTFVRAGQSACRRKR